MGRNFGGPELIHQIAINKYTNEDAITEALKSIGLDFTFEDTLEDEFIILFNLEEYNVKENVDHDDLKYTLNNSVPLKWEQDNSLTFNGFEINKTYQFKDGRYAGAEYFCSQSGTNPYYARPLYPYGFDVSLVAENPTSNSMYFSWHTNPAIYYTFLLAN